MKVKIIILLLVFCIFNINLQSFAVSDKNIHLEEEYKRQIFANYFSGNNFYCSEFDTETKHIDPNIWIYSMFLPGLSQFIEGEIGWGIFFSLITILLTGSYIYFKSTIIFNPSVSFDNIVDSIYTSVFIISFLIVYVSNILSAEYFAQDKPDMQKRQRTTIISENFYKDIIKKISINNQKVVYQFEF